MTADVPRPARRRRRGLVFGAVVSLAALAAYGVWVEPYWVEVSHHTVTAPVRTPLVVLHLSDLHTHGFGPREKTIVEVVGRERPDVIVVTGDIVDTGDLEPARAVFAQMSAPLGVWAVRGNWENWEPPPGDRAQLGSFGARLLVNEGTLVRPDVWLIGLDDPMSGSPDVAAALHAAPSDAAKIALYHSPEIFDALAPQIDLALAGHTHGGQVRVPLLGPPWTPPGSGRYVAGWYSAGSGPARMYVSRGVGTSVLPIRFACRPEIAVITVRPDGP